MHFFAGTNRVRISGIKRVSHRAYVLRACNYGFRSVGRKNKMFIVTDLIAILARPYVKDRYYYTYLSGYLGAAPGLGQRNCHWGTMIIIIKHLVSITALPPMTILEKFAMHFVCHQSQYYVIVRHNFRRVVSTRSQLKLNNGV